MKLILSSFIALCISSVLSHGDDAINLQAAPKTYSTYSAPKTYTYTYTYTYTKPVYYTAPTYSYYNTYVAPIVVVGPSYYYNPYYS